MVVLLESGAALPKRQGARCRIWSLSGLYDSGLLLKPGTPGTGSSAQYRILLMKRDTLVWSSGPYASRRGTSPAPTGSLAKNPWKRSAQCETISRMAHEPVLCVWLPCPKSFLPCDATLSSPDPILDQQTKTSIRVSFKTLATCPLSSILTYSWFPSHQGPHCASEQ
jgi:hypothetical protein